MITAAVRLSLGLALLLVRPIARLLHRVLWARPEAAPQPGREPARPSCGRERRWAPQTLPIARRRAARMRPSIRGLTALISRDVRRGTEASARCRGRTAC